jgi:signal transduction histidine kinase
MIKLNHYKYFRPYFGCILFVFLFLFIVVHSDANPLSVNYDNNKELVTIPGTSMQVLEDASNVLSIKDIISSAKFAFIPNKILNLGISKSSFWIKCSIKNNTNANNVLLALEQPMVDEADLFVQNNDGSFDSTKLGKNTSFYNRPYQYVDYVFKISISPNETKNIYIKVKSAAQMVLPFQIGTADNMADMSVYKELLFGLYAGIIFVMFLYNLFIYFSVRDRSYILYVVYILMIGLTQTTLQGYPFKYLWPDSLWFAKQSINLFSCLVGIAALEFIKEFLKTKHFFPKLHKGFYLFNGLFIVSIILSLADNRTESFKLMQADTGLASLFALFISYKIYKADYRPARFFLLSWTILLIGAIIFVLKDYGILPYTPLTVYTLQISSVAEVVLLSFALADKINIFRKEKEESQVQTLHALQENERIVREQNIILEQKVEVRTHELKLSNSDLNKAMTELKEAEIQLVESEKMASLGQLTAGIAHEINNPINFVTSNVKPLNRDVHILLDTIDEMEKMALEDSSTAQKQKRIEDYKNEIDYDYLKLEIGQLLSGINDGASRTAEIVKGLRIFSRLDEDDLKKADINEGLDSTLVLTNNMLNNLIRIEKKYANLPLIECYPGKLNQVFLNIITNGIHSVKKKFGEAGGGLIKISTTFDEGFVYIKISDNGIGMDEHTKKKLFEPFFTTKDVGEGTGLGLSIVYNTIIKHKGTIDVISELGEGAEFAVKLPLIHKY